MALVCDEPAFGEESPPEPNEYLYPGGRRRA
jgi:hypothetical protein